VIVIAKVNKVKYFTPERMALISEDNKKKYKKYLQSSIIKNPDVKSTTYKTYENFFNHFLCFLAINYDNVDLYSDEFMENAVDIMEHYISFCQETLENHKKVINTKISAVSSFYIWSMKRGFVSHHPFDKKLDRMKKASEEHILNSYFLTEEQVQTIRRELSINDAYDIQDQILFEVSYDSANRIGALLQLTLSSLDLDNMVFTGIREKEGYIVEVVFEDKAKDLLIEWLEMRKNDYDYLEVDAPLIIKHDGKWKPMGESAIRTRMRKYGQIIGIEDFRPHCMRKSKLNNVYNETGDLTLAAELANHKSTETTRASYIKPKSKSELREKINALKEKNKAENEEN
jgi:integrase/recombinase XerC